jgi:hypothetical protein
MDGASPPLQSQSQAGYTNGHASPNVNAGETPPVNGLDAPAASTSASQALPFDTSVFRNYLLALLPPILGASLIELEEGIFNDIDFDERVRQFATQPGGPLYVAKIADDLNGKSLPHLIAYQSITFPY